MVHIHAVLILICDVLVPIVGVVPGMMRPVHAVTDPLVEFTMFELLTAVDPVAGSVQVLYQKAHFADHALVSKPANEKVCTIDDVSWRSVRHFDKPPAKLAFLAPG